MLSQCGKLSTLHVGEEKKDHSWDKIIEVDVANTCLAWLIIQATERGHQLL